jgi:hypothetical protein
MLVLAVEGLLGMGSMARLGRMYRMGIRMNSQAEGGLG